MTRADMIIEMVNYVKQINDIFALHSPTDDVEPEKGISVSNGVVFRISPTGYLDEK